MTATTTTTTTPTAAPVSKNAESALPTHATVPSRIAGPRPTTGVPFGRLVHVELRKMLDTRAGRWLLIGIGAIIAVALTIMFFNEGGQHAFGEYLQATTMPMALILPVVGILAVTSEWSQRTGLVTFGLEPRRIRIAWAKLLSALLVGVCAFALSLVLAALAHQAAITFRGITGDWSMDALVLLGAGGYVLLGIAQGVGFGMLFKNTPAAVVVFFVLPTAWSILGSMVSWLRRCRDVARHEPDDAAALRGIADGRPVGPPRHLGRRLGRRAPRRRHLAPDPRRGEVAPHHEQEVCRVPDGGTRHTSACRWGETPLSVGGVRVRLDDRVVDHLGVVGVAAGVGAAEAGADELLDLLAGLGVDALPVVEGALEHRRLHAAEQVAGDGLDERLALLVVPHLADERAGLAEVVVVLAQRVGLAHHGAVGLPALLDLTDRGRRSRGPRCSARRPGRRRGGRRPSGRPACRC